MFSPIELFILPASRDELEILAARRNYQCPTSSSIHHHRFHQTVCGVGVEARRCLPSLPVSLHDTFCPALVSHCFDLKCSKRDKVIERENEKYYNRRKHVCFSVYS